MLEFGVWLGTHLLGVLQKSRVGRVGQTCTVDVLLFRISETAGRIALKFVVRTVNYIGVLQKYRVGYSCTCAPLFRTLETAGRTALNCR